MAPPLEGRVLLVEDDPALGPLIKMACDDFGYTADLATTGDQAQALLEKNGLDTYCLAWLDQNFPSSIPAYGSGASIARQIRTLEQEANESNTNRTRSNSTEPNPTKIQRMTLVISSGYTSHITEARRDTKNLNAILHIPKPFRLEALQSILKGTYQEPQP